MRNDDGLYNVEMHAGTPTISALVPVLGDYLQVYPRAEKLISEVRAHGPAPLGEIELILVLHGDTWRRALPFPSLEAVGVRILCVENTPELPALLFNRGALAARGRFLAFAWPGVDFSAWMAWLKGMCGEARSNPEAVLLAGKAAPDSLESQPLQSWKLSGREAIPPGYDGGWVEMFDYVPMCGSLVSREYFNGNGGFSASPLLQRGFWWEFTVRTTRTESITAVDSVAPACRWSETDYPLANDLGVSGDLIARRVLRRTASPPNVAETCDWRDVDAFAADLPMQARRPLRRLLRDWSPERVPPCATASAGLQNASSLAGADPLRVIVLGGINEPAHNQLCFFNYFGLLEGRGALTWRTILDTAAHPADLSKADLAIFSRARSEESCRLMDYCNRFEIPTVYMLDDNWFSIGTEWPEYASIFTPGAPVYERFLYCLTRAGHVLTYNPLLAEDLRPYCRRLEMLPVNINLELFPEVKRNGNRSLRVGYVGSPRRLEAPFQALARLAEERRDFDVFAMGNAVPEALRSVPQDRLIAARYIFGYSRYAAALCQAMPDILLAPLEDTRTDASKCPNKYLEITAAGAAGIYSETPPYIHYVTHGTNGLLVANDAASWKQAIQLLLDDGAARSSILENAQRDVRSRFDTPVVLPAFMDFLMRASGMEIRQEAAAV